MSDRRPIERIGHASQAAVEELLAVAKLQAGDIFVIGCSSSEVLAQEIGTASSEEVGVSIIESVQAALRPRSIFLAAQCCEHLNRALVLEAEAARRYGYPIVNARPQLHAGGSLATAAYASFREPVLVESIQAAAGMDIGNTLIGMHLRPVAVPVRISFSHIGAAPLVLARTRAKSIGGERAAYNPDLA